MLGRIDLEGEIVVDPAGEGAGGLADVLLGIIADAHGEELHYLAGEVLVGRALHVLGGIEIDEHGGAAGPPHPQKGGASRCPGTTGPDTPPHHPTASYTLLVRGAM